MAFEFLGAIPQNLKAGDINSNQFDIALEYIKILSINPKVHFLCYFFEKRQLIKLYNKWFFISKKWDNVLLKLQQAFAKGIPSD